MQPAPPVVESDGKAVRFSVNTPLLSCDGVIAYAQEAFVGYVRCGVRVAGLSADGGAGPKPGSPDGRRIPTAMEALSPRATGGARRTPAYRPAKPLLQSHRLRIPLYGVAGDTRLKATCSGTPAGIRSAPRDDHFDGRPYPAEAMRPGPTPFYACSWRSSRCTACCCCAAGSGHARCAVCSGGVHEGLR